MRTEQHENGIMVYRDRFDDGDFYTFDKIRDAAEGFVANFTRQENFAYFGDLEAPPWGQLGFAGQHRDSDVLDRSNHEVIRDALTELSPDAFAVEGSSHWAVGWVDIIRIDTSDDVAVAAAMAWRDALENYPVADDERYSELEHDDDEQYYQYGGRDHAIEILRDSGEFETLFDRDEEFIPAWEDALNMAFHYAMEYGDHTAIPEEDFLREMEDHMLHTGFSQEVLTTLD
jgi:hypothetical protein